MGFSFFLNLPVEITQTFILSEYADAKSLSTILIAFVSSKKHRQFGWDLILSCLCNRIHGIKGFACPGHNILHYTGSDVATHDNGWTYYPKDNKDAEIVNKKVSTERKATNRCIDSEETSRIVVPFSVASLLSSSLHQLSTLKNTSFSNSMSMPATTSLLKSETTICMTTIQSHLCQISQLFAIISFFEDSKSYFSVPKKNPSQQVSTFSNYNSQSTETPRNSTNNANNTTINSFNISNVVEIPIWCGTITMDCFHPHDYTTTRPNTANVIATMPSYTNTTNMFSLCTKINTATTSTLSMWHPGYLQKWNNLFSHQNFSSTQQGNYSKPIVATTRTLSAVALKPQPKRLMPMPPMARLRGCTPRDVHVIKSMAQQLRCLDQVATPISSFPLSSSLSFHGGRNNQHSSRRSDTQSSSSSKSDNKIRIQVMSRKQSVHRLNSNPSYLASGRRHKDKMWPLEYECHCEEVKMPISLLSGSESSNKSQRKGTDKEYVIGTTAAMTGKKKAEMQKGKCCNENIRDTSANSHHDEQGDEKKCSKKYRYVLQKAAAEIGIEEQYRISESALSIPFTNQLGYDNHDVVFNSDDNDELFAFMELYYDIDSDECEIEGLGFANGTNYVADTCQERSLTADQYQQKLSVLAKNLIHLMNCMEELTV